MSTNFHGFVISNIFTESNICGFMKLMRWRICFFYEWYNFSQKIFNGEISKSKTTLTL